MLESSVARRGFEGLLAAIAALMFFFPLLTFQIPLLGGEQVSGSNVSAKIREFRQDIRSAYGDSEGGGHHGAGIHIPRSPRHPSVPGGTTSGRSLPASVRLSWMIPVWILGGLVFAILSLTGAFLSAWLTKYSSTLGGLFGLLAIFHVEWTNSDVHNLLQASLSQGAGNAERNPLSGLVQAMGGMLINTFEIKPGGGLYVMAGCLVAVAIVAWLTKPGEASRQSEVSDQ